MGAIITPSPLKKPLLSYPQTYHSKYHTKENVAVNIILSKDAWEEIARKALLKKIKPVENYFRLTRTRLERESGTKNGGSLKIHQFRDIYTKKRVRALWFRIIDNKTKQKETENTGVVKHNEREEACTPPIIPKA